MTKATLYLYLFIGLLYILTSCGGKAKESPKPVYPISAIINNASWNISTVSCTLSIHSSDVVHPDRVMDITANGNGKTITIEFVDNSSGNSLGGETHTFPADAYFNYSLSP